MMPSGIGFPYFITDRLLDTPVRPPGWFAGGEADVLKPFLIPQLIVQDPADRAAGNFYQTNIPSAPLNWTVSPRLFVGYRLPSGFGEFSVAYRHVGSVGGTTAPILDGPTTLSSRLRFDMIDFDYSNSEFTPSPLWEMKWFVGLRFLILNYDSQAQQSFAQAAAGSGILTERIFNNSWGLGPHAGLELNRHMPDPRWSLTLRADASSLFTFMTDGIQSTTITGSPPAYPNTTNSGHQETPILFAQAGLAWQPTPASPARIFIGYQYEHMWALNFVPPTGTNPPSTGQVVTEGIVLRATLARLIRAIAVPAARRCLPHRSPPAARRIRCDGGRRSSGAVWFRDRDHVERDRDVGPAGVRDLRKRSARRELGIVVVGPQSRLLIVFGSVQR